MRAGKVRYRHDPLSVSDSSSLEVIERRSLLGVRIFRKQRGAPLPWGHRRVGESRGRRKRRADNVDGTICRRFSSSDSVFVKPKIIKRP